MELETNTPVSNEARALAQAKKLVLEPIHSSVAAEDMPDSVVVANHLREGALANASNDVEQNTPPITVLDQTEPAQPHSQVKLYILTATGFVVLAAVIVFVILGN